MMNKPAGYLSATEDNKDKTVFDLLPEDFKKLNLFCAGRLDKDSEGLLLLTNDGDFCHKIISPKSNIVKEYYVKMTNELCEEAEKHSLRVCVRRRDPVPAGKSSQNCRGLEA
jgi:16S rRNA pseudouridine516 synthase